jgi:hypothetical protein
MTRGLDPTWSLRRKGGGPRRLNNLENPGGKKGGVNVNETEEPR